MPRASLKHDMSWYVPANLRSGNIPASEIRKEYSRLRDIAQKRLARMASTKWADTQTFKQNYGFYPKLKDIKKGDGDRISSDLAYKLSALARFVSSETSTITGNERIEKRNLETLHEHGFDFVNKDNYIAFGKFMEEYRQQRQDRIYDSGDAAETYAQTERMGLDPEKVAQDFEFWLENYKELQDMQPSKGKSAGNAKRIKERIKRRQSRRRKKK